jgi:hypothetical protein
MREDPIIPGGVFRFVLALLVVVGLGAAAFAIFGKGIDINLPDLPDLETTAATSLENTELQDTTIGGAEPEAPGAFTDPFTTAGFASAIAAVQGAAGSGRQLTRLFINDVQTQFVVRTGADSVEAYSVRADSGELVREDATVTISGSATLDDFVFALDGLQPQAIDRMLSAARKQSGAQDFRPTVLSLERAIPFGSRALRWTINAQGNGRNLLYRAAADGSKVQNEGGKGTEIPPAALEAQKLNDCIQAARNDPEEIFACLDEF